MIDNKLVETLRNRFSSLHPLIFHRSLERAESAGELFDILSTMPDRYPMLWDEDSRRWTHCNDLTLSHRFDFTTLE